MRPPLVDSPHIICTCAVCVVTLGLQYYLSRSIKKLVRDSACATITNNYISTDSQQKAACGKKLVFEDIYDYSLHASFGQVEIASIEYDKTVLEFNENDSIEAVLNILAIHECSCGIVVRHDNTIIGILDTTDVTTRILQHGYKKNDSIKSYVRKKIYIYPNSSLSQVARYLMSGFRYIIVRHPTHNSIVSQGSVLRYLHANKCLMEQEEVLATSIQELGICKNQTILCMNMYDSIRDAYTTMIQKDITSLPIVDDTDKCVAVISMSDIKLFCREHAKFCTGYASHDERTSITDSEDYPYCKYISLDMNCIQFVNIDLKHDHVISCSMQSTLSSVMESMIEHHIHHIYVFGAGDEPIGVVSYIDIIRLLF